MKYENVPLTIRRAFDRCDDRYILCKENGQLPRYENDTCAGINMSAILTILIQEAGRWCERFASDMLLEYKNVEKVLQSFTPNQDEMFIFAMRQSGVDHIPFFMSRISETANSMNPYVDLSKYRRVLGLRVTVDEEMNCTCVLKKLDYSFCRLEEE